MRAADDFLAEIERSPLEGWRRLAKRAPHEPIGWARRRKPHLRSQAFDYFGRYTANNIRKWSALRGHVYDILLRNGQVVTVTPQNLAREGEGEAVVRASTNPTREPEQ